jgi:hypothetical protein
MKLLRYLPVTLLIVAASVHAITPIALNPTIIAIMDGRSFGVDGKKIGAMYNMIRRMQEILYGKKDKNGNRIGLYTFQGQSKSIAKLMEIEESIHQELNSKTLDNKRSQILVNQLKEIHEQLLKVLDDFKKIVDPFMADARSAKEPLIILIEEECSKRNKPQSMLKEWAHLDSDELEGFDSKFVSCAIFKNFSEDLITFLIDLIYNCKKGREQFDKMMKEYNQKQS